MPQRKIAHSLVVDLSDATPYPRENGSVISNYINGTTANLTRTSQHPIRQRAAFQIFILAMGEHADSNKEIQLER
jgi:hypothetical protein